MANIMIYTSYFANIKRLSGIVPISIARITPKYLTMETYLNLAPTMPMLHMPIDKYLVKYAEILAKLDPIDVLNDLEKLADGKPLALLCYEKPNEFCHRQLVSKWLNKSLNLDIEEWKDPQLTLF